VLTEPADAVLLSRAQEGDADAFGVLFERHAPSVLRFCFRRTGNATLAEDLTSIVLEAWRVRGKTAFFEGRAALVARSRAERPSLPGAGRAPPPGRPLAPSA
jgi:hypothetical protein